MEMDTPLTGTEASCTNGMETEPCVDTELEQHAGSDTVVAADRAEVETCASVEVVDVVLDDADLAGYGDRLMKDVLDNSGQEICLESHVAGVVDVSELKPCSDIQDKEVEERVGTRVMDGWSSTELPVIHECEVLDMENPVRGARIHEDVKPKQVMNDSEMEGCVENHSFEVLGNGDLKLFSCSNEVKEVGSGVGFEPCPRQEVKQQPSNDDVLSEVCNPVLTPKHVCSSLDVVSSDHGVCGETTSACSRNSCTDGSLCEEERSGCKSEPVSTSCVVLEIPKHVRPTGIRKITFKFSKRQHDSSDARPLVGDECHEDFCDNKLLVSAAEPLACNVSNNNERFNLANAEMNVSIGLSEFHDTESTFSCIPNRELKMSKKIIPDNYPTSVQKLLSTRILEGAKVKYISMSGKSQIFGIIKGCGYVCGCSACNFSKVVSAYEFEVHAGCKTRHPNNQIYLENGKPICSIIEELRTAPLTALDNVIRSIAGSSVNEEYFQVFKANLQCGNDVSYADSACPSKHLSMYNSSTSYQSHPAEDNPCPASYHYFHLNPGSYIEAPEDQKRLIKKPRHYFLGSVGEHKKVGKGGTKKRDNDLHKLLFMPNGLPDGTDLAYYSKGKRILGGYKQGNGIVCSCCDTEISPSQFEAHAGWSAKRQPYRHIYTSNGLTLHDIALMLASGRNLATSGSDDMCAICGDGGETIICNGCPRAFHASCLGLQCLPANDWHCPHCIEKFGSGRKASGDLRPIIVRLKRVVKAPEHEPGGCVVCRSQEFSAAKFDDLTVILCDQCEKEYHVGCLRNTGLCDLKELPEDKWFCCDDCIKIFEALQKLASSGPEVIPSSVSATLYKKHAETGLNDNPENEIQWRLLSGKSRFSEHLMILSRAAAIFRERFDPIVAQSGRDLIPVMVYGRNISGQEFSGMYCVVLIVKSVVVSAALLRIFGRDAAEIPLVATSRDNQGKGYFQALFSCIERLLSSMSVKHMVLPAAEEAESMWTKKLGFRKTSNEKVPEYARDLQLTIFKGTSLLEKEVQLWHD